MRCILIIADLFFLLALTRGVRERIVNPAYRDVQEGKLATTTETPRPWVRTLEDGKKSIVTPTVIASVTFYAEPPKTTNGLEPWISLKKDGVPVTIRPQVKNGITKKGWPDYGTYFANPVTILHDHDDLVAHNLKPGEVYKEVKWITPDDPEHAFDPLLRCTPASYFKKGMGRDVSSEPFCFPRDEAELKLDFTHFVTWYPRFFDLSVKKVNLHLSYVIPSATRKGFKRSDNAENEDMQKREDKQMGLVEIEKGGLVASKSFYESGWISNSKGWFALTINNDMFPDKVFTQKVAISLQPDNVENEDFNPLSHYVVVTLSKKSRVAKGSLQDLKKLEEKYANAGEEYEEYSGINYEEYIVMMTLPTCVLLFGLIMYIFVRVNKGMTDLSHLKRHRLARKRAGRFAARRGRDVPQYFSETGKHD